MNWADFKNIVTLQGLSIQYEQTADFYKLWIPHGGIISQIRLDILETPSAEQLDFEANFKANGNKPNIQQQHPFSAKALPNGKKLYKREHGIQEDLGIGQNTILFTVPYPWVKIIGLEILGGTHLDKCDLFILDSTSGTYTGVPNFVLNQFGYSVNIAAGFYEEENAYDADLYQGMQIKIIYTSIDTKSIGINFNLSEVK